MVPEVDGGARPARAVVLPAVQKGSVHEASARRQLGGDAAVKIAGGLCSKHHVLGWAGEPGVRARHNPEVVIAAGLQAYVVCAQSPDQRVYKLGNRRSIACKASNLAGLLQTFHCT